MDIENIYKHMGSIDTSREETIREKKEEVFICSQHSEFADFSILDSETTAVRRNKKFLLD